MSIFKAYDIRGVYGKDFSVHTARRIGYFVARHLGARKVVVSHDMRESSPELAEAAINGVIDAGALCLETGFASTPMNYFSVVHLDADASIQITASHNPAEYNGFKVSKRGAEPVGYDSGLNAVEKMVLNETPRCIPGGRREKVDVLKAYTSHVLSMAGKIAPLKIVVDAGNGMGGYTFPGILEGLPVKAETMFFDLDGSFPNHEANPLKVENLRYLQQKVRQNGADLGVALDGDADRCIFVDENAAPVRPDIVIGIIGCDAVMRNGGSGTVVYDVRSSRAVREDIERAGGRAIRERVGHAYIKNTMRRENALFGGELAGHYYFRENSFADSAAITMIRFLEIMTRTGKRASTLVAGVNRYPASGEINMEVKDKDGVIKSLGEEFSDGRLDFMDGITCDYPDWWFNVRKSNTEPLLRTVVEANSESVLEEGKNRVLSAIERLR